MTHAERAAKRFNEIRGVTRFDDDDLQYHIDLLRAIEETREPQPEKKVPQPLTNDELQGLGWGYIGAGAMKEDGLGIYRIKDIEEACK